MECKICGNWENNETFQIREMMFGFRDEFVYFVCAKCGCLQIAEIPKNMEKYYPPESYYSFQQEISANFIKRFLRDQRDKYALFKSGFIGRLICKKYPNSLLDMISSIKVSYDSRILDVGCGVGNLLYSLGRMGFKNLIGIDPYIDEVVMNGNVKLHKSTIHGLPDDQKFDLIICNHSFEHVPDQLATLVKLSRILSNNGTCLVRMPVKTEYIWNRYGANWVQIDAPRHLFLHSPASFELLLKKSGLIIQDMVFDSTDFQFWGSEQYKRDIPLRAGNSYSVNSGKGIFTKKQIIEFKNMAEELNREKQGDQATFYLMRSDKK